MYWGQNRDWRNRSCSQERREKQTVAIIKKRSGWYSLIYPQRYIIWQGVLYCICDTIGFGIPRGLIRPILFLSYLDGSKLDCHRSIPMPFVELPGITGKVYVPEVPQEGPKKHPCKDCYFCQMCSDDRCRLCIGPKNCKNRKSSGK